MEGGEGVREQSDAYYTHTHTKCSTPFSENGTYYPENTTTLSFYCISEIPP